MRTVPRMKGLQRFLYENVCRGREMKAPGKDQSITDIVWREPSVFRGFTPMMRDGKLIKESLPASVAPCILIMPVGAYAMQSDEERFDQYKGVHRPDELSQTFTADILHCVYEPGIRLPGFADSGDENGNGLDMSLLLEGTEEGLDVLHNWMDDTLEHLLGSPVIPGTDLWLHEHTVTYSMYTDQEYVTDRRPLYYGFIRATFGGYADKEINRAIKNLLD